MTQIFLARKSKWPTKMTKQLKTKMITTLNLHGKQLFRLAQKLHLQLSHRLNHPISNKPKEKRQHQGSALFGWNYFASSVFTQKKTFAKNHFYISTELFSLNYWGQKDPRLLPVNIISSIKRNSNLDCLCLCLQETKTTKKNLYSP